MSKASSSNSQKQKPKSKIFHRFSLECSVEGIYQYLRFEKVRIDFDENGFELKETIKKEKCFTLRKTNPDELYLIREEPTPIFILKDMDDLYVTEIPNNLGFTSSTLLGTHKCAAGSTCARLSAASDEDGGCAKVRNKARWIELYPWILLGYETFNTKQDTFQVSECEHYKANSNKKKSDSDNVAELSNSLKIFLYD